MEFVIIVDEVSEKIPGAGTVKKYTKKALGINSARKKVKRKIGALKKQREARAKVAKRNGNNNKNSTKTTNSDELESQSKIGGNSPDTKHTKIEDATIKNSKTNTNVSVTKKEFETNLESSGFTKSKSKDGKVTILKKKDSDKSYTTRDTSNSTKGPTAEVKKGSDVVEKIRLKKEEL